MHVKALKYAKLTDKEQGKKATPSQFLDRLQGLVAQLVKNPSAFSAGDLGSIPGLEKSLGEGKGYPLVFWPGKFHGQYSPWGSQSVGHN